MAVGDEFGLNEDLYHTLIGRYVATIEVLVRRGNLKDQRIAVLETQNAELEAKVFSTEKDLAVMAEARDAKKEEGDIAYGDAEGNPPE